MLMQSSCATQVMDTQLGGAAVGFLAGFGRTLRQLYLQSIPLADLPVLQAALSSMQQLQVMCILMADSICISLSGW